MKLLNEIIKYPITQISDTTLRFLCLYYTPSPSNPQYKNNTSNHSRSFYTSAIALLRKSNMQRVIPISYLIELVDRERAMFFAIIIVTITTVMLFLASVKFGC